MNLINKNEKRKKTNIKNESDGKKYYDEMIKIGSKSKSLKEDDDDKNSEKTNQENEFISKLE